MKQHLRPIRTPIILFLVFVSGGLTEAADNRIADASYNHLFDVQNIEGWTVYVNKKDLTDHAEEMKTALEHLQQQLYQVRLNVPAPAVAIMQQRVPLWFEYDTLGIAYHHRGWLVANGYRPPDVETVVGFCRARTFLDGALHQPSVVFHELAHGYDHLYLRRPSRSGHPLLVTAYDKAMKAGKYARVLCRYSSGTKAYGANNPGEFFSENSEAFFGVNDFYPFVRAELAEHDPDAYRALAILWGVDVEDLQKRQRRLVALMDEYASPAGWAEKPQPRPKSVHDGSSAPTSEYAQRTIEGWTVYVSPDLQAKKAYADEACKLLGHKLHLVRRYVPEQGLCSLQKVPIWLEENNPAVPYIVYHDDQRTLQASGLNPDKHRAVEIGNTDNFRQWQDLQPSAVLHHLACAYFDRTLKADRAVVSEALGEAAKGGKYDRVLRFDGKHVRHPALLNPREYFAEMSESYYGFNDHYPFLQFELSRHDPDACALLARLWGGKAK
ncbi:MAG: hypothetical protein HQ567_11975 [Candidatus Nealsonbacteria bacterium]|nr:hypothetical protein [Candidatus Nealsonbacteria bacterium]